MCLEQKAAVTDQIYCAYLADSKTPIESIYGSAVYANDVVGSMGFLKWTAQHIVECMLESAY